MASQKALALSRRRITSVEELGIVVPQIQMHQCLRTSHLGFCLSQEYSRQVKHCRKQALRQYMEPVAQVNNKAIL